MDEINDLVDAEKTSKDNLCPQRAQLVTPNP
jgi:hypothetical protein